METQKNNHGNKVTIFYSRYGYKNNVLVNKEILYEGNLSECPEHLLEGIEVNTSATKFVKVWN